MTNIPDSHFDAVVVGSGFGGSVTAYRLAEAGLRVCLLERGRAYPPGSFPRSPYKMRRNFWDPRAGLHGLYHFWAFRGVDALVASGLGGGSLIYANVLMRKDERWFVKEDLTDGGYEHWPVSRADLEDHYDRVEDMLGAQRYPLDHEPYRQTPKTLAFKAAAEANRLDWFLPKLAVTFGNPGEEPVPGVPIAEEHPNLHGVPRFACRLVGECDVGCNFGAKNTLDLTYLSAAQRHGAELRTGADVRLVRPRPGGGYEVAYVTHPPDGADTGANGNGNGNGRGRLERVTADQLVLAAGSLGTTALLLRNRSAFPRISRTLGTRFCGNGDLLTFAVRCRDRSAGDGRVPRVVDPGYGPVITSAVRVPDAVDGGEGRGFYLEDAGFPDHVSWMLQTLATPAALWKWRGQVVQLAGKAVRGASVNDMSAAFAGLFGTSELSAGVLPLLAMGRDIPDGRMVLRRGDLRIEWRRAKSEAYFRRVRRVAKDVADELGGTFVDNPIWFASKVITVHPLGGAPMGRHPGEGVVDANGEVFGYPGLRIVDGAAMPGPVGPNPSLTIAALADRFADHMIETGRKRAGRREAAA